MPAVLLVGGAGYLGSVLADELLRQGYAVRVLDSLCFGGHALDGIRDRVELVESDMRTVEDRVFTGVDTVINVAGVSNEATAEYDPTTCFELNTRASTALASASQQNGVKRYVLASSCAVYASPLLPGSAGDALGEGCGEWSDILLDEEADLDPQGAYAGSKLAAERELLPLARRSFCVSALRLGTLFGFSRRMRYDLVVNTFVKDALCKGQIDVHHGGEMWRPLVEVRDAARACVAVLRADIGSVNGEVFNVVHRNLRISQVASRVLEALQELGVHAVIKRRDTSRRGHSYRVNGEKLARTIGFEPSLGIEESVRRMVESIGRSRYDDFSNPRYYNFSCMRLSEEAAQRVCQPSGLLR